jgi:predicted RNA-binding Zn-ribbon protein involved in translation (DUF1610 family)
MALDQSNRYVVKVVCTNCGHKGDVSIMKGTRVSSKQCPNCDCNDLMLDRPNKPK